MQYLFCICKCSLFKLTINDVKTSIQSSTYFNNTLNQTKCRTAPLENKSPLMFISISSVYCVDSWIDSNHLQQFPKLSE